jgi:opacity protein-like surface antigen
VHSAYTGWQMNGDVNAYAGKLQIADAMNYGVALDVPLAYGSGLQLLWIYNDTTARFASYDPFYPSSREFGLQQHYFQVGGNKAIRRGKIETFGGGTLGAALFLPGTVQTSTGSTLQAGDTWAFAMTLGGGVKVFFTEKVALRLGARLMLPMFFQGGGFYVGSGGSGMRSAPASPRCRATSRPA